MNILKKSIAVSLLGFGSLACAMTVNAATIEENFDGNQFTSSDFEMVGSSYFSNGTLIAQNRDLFRTKEQYFASENAPILFGFTMRFLGGDDIGLVGLRSSVNPLDPTWKEPVDGLRLRAHNFQGGHTGIGSGGTGPGNDYEYFNPANGAAFYGAGASIRTEIMDYGNYVNVTMTNLSNSQINAFTYTNDFSAGGYYSFSSSGSVAIDDVVLTQNATASVPVPATLGLLAVSMLGFSARRRKQQAS